MRSRLLGTVKTLGISAVLCAIASFANTQPAEANTTNCYVATSQAAHSLCFLDFGGYTLADGTTTTQTYPFTIKLPDGSLVSGTITNAGPAIGPAANNPTLGIMTGIVPLPTLGTSHNGGSALGNYSATAVAAGDATSTTYEGGYLGVAGNPAFYNNNTVGPISLGNISIVDSTGASEGSTITVAAADAEITAAADYDGGIGGLYWSTTGGNLTEVQLLNQMSTTTSICTFTLNALTATCIAKTGQPDPGSAYILSSRLTAAAQTFSVKTITSNVNGEGFAFAFALGTLNVAKTVNSRIGTDQFKVSVVHGTSTAFSATTTGTTTGAASTVTAGGGVVPGIPYTLTDAVTTGSNPISQYVSTVTCVNAKSGSTTTLPAAGTVATSVTITPAIDDQITCTFTNNALSLTNTAVKTTATDPMNTAETDSFTLTNTSAIAGTFVVQAPTITPFTGTTAGTAVTPTGYSLTVGTTTTTYTTLAALNAALAGMTATAAGGSVVIGVTYTTSGGGATSDVVSLPATIGSGTGTSTAVAATETDSLTPAASLTIVKSGTTATSPGGLIGYSILVTNNGPSPATGALFSDPLPTGVTIQGTPTCATTSGGAVCGTVTVTAANGTNPEMVTSTIGIFPSGSSLTFTIDASAATTCGNATTPCTYVNTASIADPSGTTGTTQTSSLSTVVQQSSGLSKTVKNITQAGSAVTANTAKPGDLLEYVLTFTNTTSSPLYGLILNDTVPTHTTYIAINATTPVTCVVAQSAANPPACTATVNAGSTIVTGTLPTKASGSPLAAGGSVTLTFHVTVL